jgi:hypothetical protein
MSAIRWFLIALTVLGLVSFVAGLTTEIARNDAGFPGYSTRWPQLVVRAVRPGYSAERAGMRPGDIIDLSRMSLHDRLLAVNYSTPIAGQSIDLAVLRDGTAHTFVVRYALDAVRIEQHTMVAFVRMATAVLLAILVIFVLMRTPSIEAFALWGLAAMFIREPTSSISYLAPDWLTALYNGSLTDVLCGVLCTGMIVLALRATGRWPHRERFEWGAVALGFLIFGLTEYADVSLLAFGRVPPPILSLLAFQNFVVPSIVTAAIVTAALLRTRGQARIRLRWIAIGFGCLVAGYLAGFLDFLPALDFVIWPVLLRLFLFNAGFATLAYAIIRRDLFDVGFVINRAAIYTSLTAVLVGAFAGLNWSIGVLLKQTGLALPVDVILAAAVGLSLNVIQRRVDRNVDRIFFRHRYEAEQRLRRVARALTNVTEAAAISQALVVEPVEALGLHAGAFYRVSATGAYELVAAHGWPDDAPTEVSAGDPLVLHLSGANEGLRLESVPHDAAFPHGAPRPRIAFPMWSRRELIAFAVYSTHRNGALLDPDEVELIERIAAAATVALERVAAISLHDRFATLAADFESIKAQRDEFLAILSRNAATS